MDQKLSRRTVLRGAAAAGVLATGHGASARAQEASPVPTDDSTESRFSSGPITIFEARKIVTLHSVVPEATHVAVRNGRVLGAGTLDELAGWGDYTLDETFKDLVIVPGFIEAHNHVIEGMMAFLPYVGYYDRPAVDGTTLSGITTQEDLLEFLKAEDAKLSDPDAPLIAIEFDPLFFHDQPAIDKTFLDQVSTTRHIALWYASEHTLMLNTAALQANNITSAATDPGVVMGDDGEPTGELNSPAAMGLAASLFNPLVEMTGDPATIEALGRFATNAGCTMVTDMANTVLVNPAGLDAWRETVNADDYPVRVGLYAQPLLPGSPVTPDNVAQTFLDLRNAEQTEKLRFPGVKLMLDGSVQDLTADMDWPGYYQATNDLQGPLMTEDEVVAWLTPLQAAGIQAAAHTNGAHAVESFLNAVERVSRTTPALDLRHVAEHSQLTTPAQYARMANLGVCANIFANHLWYYGDLHYEITVGPQRAAGIEAAGTALAHGVPFSLHTDASVTPLGCLHSMWCAVNRVTPKGRVLGESEKLTPEQALHAVTLGSAYLLHLDGMMGSIEPGKFADFAVLEESPLDVDPMAIRDIKVWGTVLGGVKHPAAGTAS